MTLRNIGNAGANFAVDERSLPSAISVFPTKGRIQAGEFQDFKVFVKI